MEYVGSKNTRSIREQLLYVRLKKKQTIKVISFELTNEKVIR